jgi:hypothetical protein
LPNGYLAVASTCKFENVFLVDGNIFCDRYGPYL